MNIEQLNGSGQRLSAFITTAVVTLAVTGGSWFLIEQVNSYRKWRKRRPDALYDGKTQFALVIRLAMLVFLVSHGHSKWMWKSGAWWRILVNSRALLKNDFTSHHWTAGNYVSTFMRGIYSPYRSTWFDVYDPVQWIDVKEDEEEKWS